ncbi:MAG: zinc ribbon domain-containing protein [Chloroflexi bacterium]|nr:zinc ribbon domain-containing protein [Chloroflexota bacterium]
MDAETVISIFLGALLAAFSFAVVFYAFIRRRQPQPTAADAPPGTDDQALADIFDAITTLDLEYQLGRMPEEDFQAQFQAYRVQAATALRDQLEAGSADPAWVLEQEILLARDAKGIAGVRVIACPNCSAAVPRSTPACPHCGAEMAPLP